MTHEERLALLQETLSKITPEELYQELKSYDVGDGVTVREFIKGWDIEPPTGKGIDILAEIPVTRQEELSAMADLINRTEHECKTLEEVRHLMNSGEE